MADYRIDIDGRLRTVEDVPEWLPLLWVLRDKLGITGPKYGCGVGACRACTCHITDDQGGYTEFQPCVTPVSEIGDRSVRTIAGLAAEDGTLHPVQEAWAELDVPQCGFCQPGQIMTATALLFNQDNQVSDADIDAIENVCRCGTYARIRDAIKVAAQRLAEADDPDGDFGDTRPGGGRRRVADTPAADRSNGRPGGGGDPDPAGAVRDAVGGGGDTPATPTPPEGGSSDGAGPLSGLLGRR